MNKELNNKKISGQIALIVLLVSTVVMTLGLSLSKKSVVETRVDIDDELLRQAFNAAESGVDYYLATEGDETSYESGDQSMADVSVTDIGNTQTIDFGEYTVEGGMETYWLVGHDSTDDNNIDETDSYGGTRISVCWSEGFSGGLKVDYFYNDGDYKVVRRLYNVNGDDYINGADNVADGANGHCPGGRGVDINMIGTPLLLAVKPIGSGTRLSIVGNANFPKMGEEIVSEGRAGDVEEDEGVVVRRKVVVQKRFPVPSFMVDALTARGNIYRE